MTGDEHYLEAERLVETAGAVARDAHHQEDVDGHRWLADSAMKAAHVHAMLAVAAATAAPRMTYTSGETGTTSSDVGPARGWEGIVGG